MWNVNDILFLFFNVGIVILVKMFLIVLDLFDFSEKWVIFLCIGVKELLLM